MRKSSSTASHSTACADSVNRFRRSINLNLGGGSTLLSTPAVVGIDVVGVWVVNLVTFYLTRWVNPALGLLAIYLTITNAAAHVLFAIVQRRNHPGLPTAILALTPCGIWALMATPGPFVTAADHVGAATFATLLRAAIGAWVRLVLLNSRSHQGSV